MCHGDLASRNPGRVELPPAQGPSVHRCTCRVREQVGLDPAVAACRPQPSAQTARDREAAPLPLGTPRLSRSQGWPTPLPSSSSDTDTSSKGGAPGHQEHRALAQPSLGPTSAPAPAVPGQGGPGRLCRQHHRPWLGLLPGSVLSILVSGHGGGPHAGDLQGSEGPLGSGQLDQGAMPSTNSSQGSCSSLASLPQGCGAGAFLGSQGWLWGGLRRQLQALPRLGSTGARK